MKEKAVCLQLQVAKVILVSMFGTTHVWTHLLKKMKFGRAFILLQLMCVTILYCKGCPPKARRVVEKCVFIVSTGRSGSSALQDALNQLPAVHIRGENGGIIPQLHGLHNHITAFSFPPSAHPPDSIKMYLKNIENGARPSWYNGFAPDAADRAVQSAFSELYEIPGYTVGFKEIRYALKYPVIKMFKHRDPYSIRAIQHTYDMNVSTYRALSDQLGFLKKLCTTPKIIINMRRNVTATHQSNFWRKADISVLASMTDMFLNYAASHPETMLVYFEDMFNPVTNQTLADTLKRFLQVDESSAMTFARVGPG